MRERDALDGVTEAGSGLSLPSPPASECLCYRWGEASRLNLCVSTLLLPSGAFDRPNVPTMRCVARP